MERIYKPLPELSDEEIIRILQSGTIEEQITLPLAVGQNHSKWKTAQDICVELANHTDERVRANAALGLAYVARTKSRLEKHVVKPVLLKLLGDCEEYRWRVIDAIKDINLYLQWHIGEKAIDRLEVN